MSGAVIDPRLQAARQAPRKKLQASWSDPRFRNIVWQVVIIGLVVAVIWYLWSNTARNLEARHITTGTAFLSRPAPIPIGESLLGYVPSVSTYGRALVIGVLNTLQVAVIGIVLTTLLGTVIGIARLSRNWLMARLAAVYVEVIRDVPLLLQLFFWYALLQSLPGPRQAFKPGPTGLLGLFGLPAPGWLDWKPVVFLSNRGVLIPWIDWHPAYAWCLAALGAGLVGAVLLERWATSLQERTGRRPRTWPAALALLIVPPLLVGLALRAPFSIDVPELRGFNFQGGLTITPEYGALLIGLVVYTASYIAEIVRSGILAVPTGQWEAAGALGLRHGAVLRRIVLPQAFRVIIPPMTSQYLNLTKNSSLAVAVGFQDIVSIATTTINQTGQAIEGMAVIMTVYLTISLSISAFMNWYNARVALVER